MVLSSFFVALHLSLIASACPVPADRLFGAFTALRNHTDAEVFAMTCLDDLVAGGVAPILGRMRAEKHAVAPLQAALLLRKVDDREQAGAATARNIRKMLQETLNTVRPALGYWIDPRMELRQSKGGRGKVVAVGKGKGIGTAGVAKGSGDAYVDPLEVTLLEQTAAEARVRVRGATGWVDKRKLILPAVLGFRGPDDRAPLATFVRVNDELVVLRADARTFLLGFPAEAPTAGLTLTCDRVTGRVTEVGSSAGSAPAQAKANGDAAAPTPPLLPKQFFQGRDCVSFAADGGAGHAMVQPGRQVEGRFFVHGWPADCRY
jgi:hypothetical protein